jgi:hypothetical protein
MAALPARYNANTALIAPIQARILTSLQTYGRASPASSITCVRIHCLHISDSTAVVVMIWLQSRGSANKPFVIYGMGAINSDSAIDANRAPAPNDALAEWIFARRTFLKAR